MAVSKNVTITEGKTVNFRVDINNILNHPTPSGSAPFSYDQRTYAPGNPISDMNSVTSSIPSDTWATRSDTESSLLSFDSRF